MANVDAPHGFVPVRTLDGSCITTSRYNVAAANAAIGIGDMIVVAGTGLVDRGAATPAVGTVVGVAAEPKAASSGGTMLVYDNPSIVYEGQTDDGTGAATAITCIGANGNIVATAPANGISKMEIDDSVATTTSTLPIKLLRLYPVVGNAFGEFNRLEFVFNTSFLKGDGSTGL